MVHVTLYMKPACHLCETALSALDRLQARYPHIVQPIDISTDTDLLQRYGERIPVLVVNGAEYDAPLMPAALERALRAAVADRSPAPDTAPPAAGRSPAPDTTPPVADRSPAPDTTPPVADRSPAPDTTPPAADRSPAPDTTPPAADSTPPAVDRQSPAVDRQSSNHKPIALTVANRALRHWLLGLNLALGLFLAGALAAPVFAQLGWTSLAQPIYAAYHFTCHQWAFRSFFLFGQQPVYGEQQLADLGLDPFTVIGNPSLGWKMAFCERDLAIYIGLLLVGLLYARRRDLRPSGFLVYGVLILPMALDGFTQLFGWRESTWELRVVTGLLFGLASAWLVLPRLDDAFGLRPPIRQYAPDAACAPLHPASPLSPRG
jgi:uncharacterized membrane protein